MESYRKSFPEAEPVPRRRESFWLKGRHRFTLDPLFRARVYYVQEAALLFLDHVLQQVIPALSVSGTFCVIFGRALKTAIC